MKKKNLFLSYCWKDSNEADKIYDFFKSSRNIELHRDTIDIGKWESIKEYMQSISDMDYTILLISDVYLKSANCMYEVLEVMRDRNYRDKIFPAVIYSGIYNPITRAKYVKHWQDEFSELESTLKEINVQNLGKLNEDLKRRQDISSNIAEFLDVVSDMNNPNIADVCMNIEEKLSQQGFLGNNQIRDENDLMEDINHIKENMNGEKGENVEHFSAISLKNKSQYYADKWDKNVFLDDFDEEDEKAGDRVNVKLKDIYLEELLPPYILNENRDLSYTLKARLKKYIVDKKDRKMLLILGQPGIGKSTLITWIMANLVEKKDEIFVYQFASDLKQVNWKGENILEEIFIALRLRDKEMQNNVLILDGFDEISTSVDRERILNKLYQELEKMNCLGNFSLIITCRENYVNRSRLKVKNYITLQAWNEEQIKSFCKIYKEKSLGKKVEIKNNRISERQIIKILEKKEIFGVPLILYMVLASNVDIERSSSMAEIYDQIFSLEIGSIYDRCYEIEHRINSPKIRRCIHQVSQRIAFRMFENNSEEASILQKEFKKICDIVISETGVRNENLQSDALIGNYFTTIKHCDGVGTDELQFIHRSIYEYFVAVHFFESICNLTSKEEVAGKLGDLLKDGHLTVQMLGFIKYKFDSIKRFNLSDATKNIFNLMLRSGMTYYAEIENSCNNVIKREINIFLNMIEIVSLWNTDLGEVDNKIIIYLQCNRQNNLNLKGIKLDIINSNMKYLDLRRVYLREANLRGAFLNEAFLNRAFLEGVNLIEADLRGACLNEACMEKADLHGVKLVEADLSGANLNHTKLEEGDLERAHFTRAIMYVANLKKAILREADLRGADLRWANLKKAILVNADLKDIRLEEANLKETIFDETQVELLYEKYDLSNSLVALFKIKKIISYEEYCVRKQQM